MKNLKLRCLVDLGISLGVLMTVAGCSGKAVNSSAPGEATFQPGTHQVIPLVGTFQVHRYTLDNEMRLLVVEDHSSPTFAYYTWFRVGSRDEVPGYTGLAHLFEHMMFKGTKNHPDGDLEKIMEAAGAEGENAFTSRDYTAYVQEMPKDKLDLIMGLESDRMVNLIVDEKVFKTETEVVQNERRFRTENNPDGQMFQALFDIAFTVHPYHWPVIGYSEDLERMHAEDAMKFYRAHYNPNHATVVVTGDVNADQVRLMAEKYYGGLRAVDSPPHVITPEPPQTSPRRKELKINIQVEKLFMGYHIPENINDDIPALAALQSIMTGGKSSRLSRALVDTGIATSVDSEDLEDKDPSLFIIVASLQKDKHTSTAETIIQREMDKVAKEPVAEEELQRAKNKLSFGFLEGLDSNAERAQFLGHYESVAGNFEEGLKQNERIKHLTTQDILRVAAKYFSINNRTTVTGVPQ